MTEEKDTDEATELMDEDRLCWWLSPLMRDDVGCRLARRVDPCSDPPHCDPYAEWRRRMGFMGRDWECNDEETEWAIE